MPAPRLVIEGVPFALLQRAEQRLRGLIAAVYSDGSDPEGREALEVLRAGLEDALDRATLAPATVAGQLALGEPVPAHAPGQLAPDDRGRAATPPKSSSTGARVSTAAAAMASWNRSPTWQRIGSSSAASESARQL
jgi:hypothetical protein